MYILDLASRITYIIKVILITLFLDYICFRFVYIEIYKQKLP